MLNVDAAATPQQLREITAQLRGQPRSLIDALIGAVVPNARRSAPDLAGDIWGRSPTDAEIRRAAVDNLALGVDRRNAVLEASLTRSEVARRLGKTTQAVSAMLERGALVGLKVGREWRIPDWQLDADQVDGVLPGLRPLVSTFRDGVVSLSEWVDRPHADLD